MSSPYYKSWGCGCCAPIVRGHLFRFKRDKSRQYRVTQVKPSGINLCLDGAGHEQQTYDYHTLVIAGEYSRDKGVTWERCGKEHNTIPPNHIVICGDVLLDISHTLTSSGIASGEAI